MKRSLYLAVLPVAATLLATTVGPAIAAETTGPTTAQIAAKLAKATKSTPTKSPASITVKSRTPAKASKSTVPPLVRKLRADKSTNRAVTVTPTFRKSATKLGTSIAAMVVKRTTVVIPATIESQPGLKAYEAELAWLQWKKSQELSAAIDKAGPLIDARWAEQLAAAEAAMVIAADAFWAVADGPDADRINTAYAALDRATRAYDVLEDQYIVEYTAAVDAIIDALDLKYDTLIEQARAALARAQADLG